MPPNPYCCFLSDWFLLHYRWINRNYSFDSTLDINVPADTFCSFRFSLLHLVMGISAL
jgi:hypothetical protein